MISSWLNKAAGVVGAQSPTLSHQSTSPSFIKVDRRLLQQDSHLAQNNNNNTNNKHLVDSITRVVLTKIDLLVSEQLGEQYKDEGTIEALRKELVEGLSQLGVQNNNNTHLEGLIVETKEKYNELVDSINTNRLKLKRFHEQLYSLFENYVIVQSELLQTNEFSVPLKEIRKGILDMIPETLDKHMNLLCKLLPYEYQKAISTSLNKKQEDSAENVKTLKGQLKKIEAQMTAVKEAKKQLENQLKEAQDSKSLLSQKVKQSQNNVKLAEQLSQQISKEKTQQIERQLNQKLTNSALMIESLEREVRKMAETNKQLVSQITTLNDLAEETRYQHKTEMESLEKKYVGSIKRLNQDRLMLEEKYAELTIKHNVLIQEQQTAIDKAVQDKLQLHKDLADRVKELEKDVATLREQKRSLQQQMTGMVDRLVVKGMLEVYMDEGKPWQIKNQIQRKLMALLSINQKKPPVTTISTPADQKSGDTQQKKSGWFASFF